MKRLFVLVLLLLCAPVRAEVTEEKIQAVLPALEQYVEKGRADWNVPAVAVGIVHHDKLVYFKGFGKKSDQDPTPPDQDTLFAVGSTTKAYCAATLAMMVDEGKLRWNERVVDADPAFRMYDPWVTREFRVADLLAQHTGMAPYVLTTYLCLGYTPDDAVQAMALQEPVTSFRTTFAYVNIPHIVAGNLVARLSGEPNWEAFLQKRLLDPLGMRRTSYGPEAFNRDPNRAVGHFTLEGKLVEVPASKFPYNAGPAGALNSCVADVSHWIRLQLADGLYEGKQLISKDNLDRTKFPETPLASTAAYCMGWLIVYKHPSNIIWHNGGTPGHRSFVGLCPAQDLGIVVLTNNGEADLSDAVGLRFFDLVQDVEGEDYSQLMLERSLEGKAEVKKMMTPPAGAAPPRPLSEYAGTYHNPALGDVVVSPSGQRLAFRLPKPGVDGYLAPYDGDVFVAHSTTPWAVQDGAELLGKWTFVRGMDGPFQSLRCVLGDGESGCTLVAEKKG